MDAEVHRTALVAPLAFWPHRPLTMRLPLALPVALVAGCDTTAITTPSGPESLTVDFTARFDRDLVRIELDGEPIYEERVTTEDVLSLAARASFEIPEGWHQFRVQVGGRASAATEFYAGEVVFVSVFFDPDEDDVDLALSDEVFCCYD